jgi:hypothetical protein
MTDTDHTDQKREALALRHVFHQPEEDRAEMLETLEESALPLRAVIAHARAIHRKAPQARWEDVWADLGSMKAVSVPDAAKTVLAGAAPPSDAAAAYRATLNASDDIREKQAAAAIAEAAKNRKPGWERDVERIIDSQRRREVAAEDLAAGWERHRVMMNGNEAGLKEAIQLHPNRGEWASTVNAWLGVRGGLMPGKALLIGGGAGGGKTSLASVFAWDALAAECPVTLYQLELGRWAAVEYLLRQNPDKTPPLDIFGAALPSHWPRLLDVPADPSPKGEDAVDALKAMVRRAERLRKVNGEKAHAANGLFIVDYVQLFAKASTGDAFHEALANTVSRLVKTAANEGACLVLASQVNKGAQSGELNQTAFAGADLARMPDVAVTIERATYKKEKGEFASAGDKDAGQENGYHARLIKRQKERGQLLTQRMPDGAAGVWLKGGTLRGKPEAEPEKNSERRTRA